MKARSWEWMVLDCSSTACLPDPMRTYFAWHGPHSAPCDTRKPGAPWVCTRPRSHTARHAASNGKNILAVWP